MLKMMSYEVPLDGLYTIKSACCGNELNHHCPIVLEITNPELKQLYKGTHLIQIYNKQGTLLFERTRTETLTCLSLVGSFFVFKKTLQPEDRAFHSKYEIIKLQPSKVQLICEVEILKDATCVEDDDIAVAICDNMLVVASQNKLKYADLG